MVTSQTLFGFFGLKCLVLTSRFHTSHAFVVAPTVKSLHVLYPVHGGILSLSIQLLDDPIFIGVPLFFLGGLAQSWRIHDLTQVIERHTRLPTLVVFGKDSVWSVCSVEPRHDGPAVAVRFARGSGGNNPDSGDVLGPNAWLGNDYRPVGSPLGPWLFVLVLGLVWVEVVV